MSSQSQASDSDPRLCEVFVTRATLKPHLSLPSESGWWLQPVQRGESHMVFLPRLGHTVGDPAPALCPTLGCPIRGVTTLSHSVSQSGLEWNRPGLPAGSQHWRKQGFKPPDDHSQQGRHSQPSSLPSRHGRRRVAKRSHSQWALWKFPRPEFTSMGWFGVAKLCGHWLQGDRFWNNRLHRRMLCSLPRLPRARCVWGVMMAWQDNDLNYAPRKSQDVQRYTDVPSELNSLYKTPTHPAAEHSRSTSQWNGVRKQNSWKHSTQWGPCYIDTEMSIW